MQNVLYTEIRIEAKKELVWQVLMDFAQYASWNSFIPSIQGSAQEGKNLRVYIRPPEATGMTLKPIVTRLVPNTIFSWKGKLGVKGLFDGEHSFEVHDNGDGSTTFVHRETFSGILTPLFKRLIMDNTRRGFETMNQQLKARVESSRH